MFSGSANGHSSLHSCFRLFFPLITQGLNGGVEGSSGQDRGPV